MNNTEFFNKDDIVKVVLPIASDSYDYFIPEDNLYKIGSLVNVNFKNKNQIGVILNKTTEEITYDKTKIKFILKEIKNYTFSQSHLNFINKVANYTLSPIGCVIQMSICFNKLEDYEKETKEVNYDLNYISPSLSNEQITAVNQLVKNLFNGFSVSVLDGVTGSGKTEVYFNVVNKVLEKSDSQVLILLPEIALTGQFIIKFKNRFQIDPIVVFQRLKN